MNSIIFAPPKQVIPPKKDDEKIKVTNIGSISLAQSFKTQ